MCVGIERNDIESRIYILPFCLPIMNNIYCRGIGLVLVLGKC
jgi:hypothetical protein